MEKKVDSAEKAFIILEAREKEILRVLSLLLLVIIVFLFLRIVLQLIGSNPDTLFVEFVYIISGIFLLPFWGILPQFHDTPTAGKVVVDLAAFIALFCYIIIILLSMFAVWIITLICKTGKQVEETVKKNHPIDPTKAEQMVK